MAFVPDVSVTLSLRALLKGRIAPTYVEVIRPQIIIERQMDGQLAIGSAPTLDTAGDPDSPPHGEGGEVLRALLEDLLARPNPDRALSFLTRVRVDDAELALRDMASGRDWQASGVVLELRRARARDQRRDGGAPRDGPRAGRSGAGLHL